MDKRVILAALRRDPELIKTVTKSLRGKIGDEGRLATAAQAAGALEPILEEAVRKNPSRLGKLGLASTHLLAGLVTEDQRSNSLLESMASGSPIGIVFVDVADFTAFTEVEGDQAAGRMLSRLSDIIEVSIKPVGGQVVKKLGDGFLLAFPTGSQAVRAAMSIRDRMQRESMKPGGPVPRLRIAVHAGEPLVEEDDLLGFDVNLAARLLDHCSPGEVVVSEAAKDLAEKRLKKISFGKPKRVKIRGLSTKVTIYPANPQKQPASVREARRSGSRPPRGAARAT